jgi:hypothetical protein
MSRSGNISRITTVEPFVPEIRKSMKKSIENKTDLTASKSRQRKLNRPPATVSVVRVPRSQRSFLINDQSSNQQQSYNDPFAYDNSYAPMSDDMQSAFYYNSQLPFSSKLVFDPVRLKLSIKI